MTLQRQFTTVTATLAAIIAAQQLAFLWLSHLVQ